MRVLVRGAGIIGLAVAEELLLRGHRVRVVDPAPCSGASGVAAGMLAPAAEASWAAPGVLDLGLRGLALWPGYADRLGVPLAAAGTVLVARDGRDLVEARRQAALLAEHGIEAVPLDPPALAQVEPRLTSRAAGGVLLPGDRSVDPRAVLAALLERVEVDAGDDAVDAAVDAGAGVGVDHDVEVLATGCSLRAPYSHLVRPVRGEVVRLRSDDPPSRVVRGWVFGEPVYLVPRANGEVVVGATVEEHDEPAVPTAGGVRRLLAAAAELLPGIDRAAVVEVAARDRPGSPDDLPLVGPTHDPGVVLAAGHFRHGVLLAPLTALLVADLLEGADPDPLTDPRRLLEAPCTTRP